MGQFTIAANLNNKETINNVPPVTPSPKIEPNKSIQIHVTSAKTFFLYVTFLLCLIGIPVFATFTFTRFSYRKEIEQYKITSNNQIAELRTQINLLSNPAVKQLDQLENIVKLKKMQYFREKEEAEKDPVYQELIKKTKELDKQIIICNVHLQNIEIVKQNNYKDVETLIEKLNKENIK